jgi:hypothetical protein
LVGRNSASELLDAHHSLLFFGQILPGPNWLNCREEQSITSMLISLGHEAIRVVGLWSHQRDVPKWLNSVLKRGKI